MEHGDCLAVMQRLLDEGVRVDAVITDPPYHLTSIVKRFGKEDSAPAKVGATGAYARASRGFMGKEWDGGDIAFRAETWALALQLLKPGGHMVAFSGTRTYHRMACAIEDAGFEIRDQLAWVFGSGFPKSHNIGKATGLPEWDGWGSALKPAYEPVCLARKPLDGTLADNTLKHGCGGLNIDACRVEAPEGLTTGGNQGRMPQPEDWGSASRIGRAEPHQAGRFPSNLIHDGSPEVLAGFPETGGDSRTEKGSSASLGYHGGTTGATTACYPESGGSAARFFYTAKADAADRLGSKHPTVKPVDLMAWLCRLITPRGGLILDPFAGSGTTGMAAMREGFDAILIEREAEYVADIHRRLAHVKGEDAPLFAAPAQGGLL